MKLGSLHNGSKSHSENVQVTSLRIFPLLLSIKMRHFFSCSMQRASPVDESSKCAYPKPSSLTGKVSENHRLRVTSALPFLLLRLCSSIRYSPNRLLLASQLICNWLNVIGSRDLLMIYKWSTSVYPPVLASGPKQKTFFISTTTRFLFSRCFSIQFHVDSAAPKIAIPSVIQLWLQIAHCMNSFTYASSPFP